MIMKDNVNVGKLETIVKLVTIRILNVLNIILKLKYMILINQLKLLHSVSSFSNRLYVEAFQVHVMSI